MSLEQHKVLDIINKAISGYITVQEAASKLELSTRQIQRLKKKVALEGPAALIHKNTLRKPAHSLTTETIEAVLEKKSLPAYKNANFAHFREILEEDDNIVLSYSTLHRLLSANSHKSPKTKRRFKAHKRRKPREQQGSLIQVDATPFAWFSDGIPYALHGAIDDATGQITGLYLTKNECMNGYYEVFRSTFMTFGIPEAIYADRHTIFRSPNADKRASVDYDPGTPVNETQLGRAMAELSIRIIAARSPQAKGRIERLWNTLQSRLPVEFARRGITDIEAANLFLREFIFIFNSQFAHEPADRDSAFLPLGEHQNLDHILCVKEQRILDHGFTFSYHGKCFKLGDHPQLSWLPPKAKLTVLSSPHIGVMAAYKNLLFTAIPYARSKTSQTKQPPKEKVPSPGLSGLAWQPGLPSHREVLEVLNDIFSKQYA